MFLLGNFRALQSDEQHILVAFGSDLDENRYSQFENLLIAVKCCKQYEERWIERRNHNYCSCSGLSLVEDISPNCPAETALTCK